MVDYMKAIAVPFSDPRAFLIGAVISIIGAILAPFTLGLTGLIAILIVAGFGVSVAQNIIKKSEKLPEWEDWANLLTKGILAFVIAIVYLIPAIVLFAIAIGTGIIATVIALLTLNLAGPITSLAVVGTLGLVGMILVILALFFLPAGLIAYAAKGNAGDAFNFSRVVSKALTADYIVSWIAFAIYAAIVIAVVGIVGGVLSIFPTIIGSIIVGMWMAVAGGTAAFIIQTTLYCIFAQAVSPAAPAKPTKKWKAKAK